MLNGNLFQFEEYQSQDHQQALEAQMNVDTAAVNDIRDYLTYDLKLSDFTLSDLFSDFDTNAPDLQLDETQFDHETYSDITNQTTLTNHAELPPTYDSVLLSNNTNNIPSISVMQPCLDEYLPAKSLMEQQQTQQSMVKYSPSASSPPMSMHSTIYSETSSLLPTDAQEYVVAKNASARKTNSSKRIRPSGLTHLPKLIKKPEPIPVTMDQFQALMCTAPDSSTSHAGKFSTLFENGTIIGNNIPLKIINHTNQTASHSSDENSRHDSPINITATNTNFSNHIQHPTGRLRRKSSHNAIEKRYRSSINERILELKEIVADTDEKVQKSGVLRRTVEYIRQLQLTNRRLEEENNTLKTILKRLNLTSENVSTDRTSLTLDPISPDKHFTTPPSSQSESSESTLGSSDEATSPMPKKQKRTTGKQGMVNGSRLVLCCFMLCVLITNPVSYLLNRIHESDFDDPTELRSIVGSRTLQSVASSKDDSDSSALFSTSWRQLIAWMLNIAICLVCLVKLFVYGEPIVSEGEMQDYDVYKKKADQLMAKNLSNDARVFYLQCCEKLYVTIDNSLLYYFSSITWQMTRFCVNLIFLGRWLTFWSGWTKSIDTRDYNRELNDCLLQLWKIEYEYSSSSLALFNLFISTINTSMHAGKKLDLKKRNEIHFLSSLTLKRFGGIFSLFVPYVLKRLQVTDLNDIWLVDLDRLKEFVFDKEKVEFKHGQVLESIRQDYFDYVLYEDIRNQLTTHQDPQTNVCIQDESNLNAFSWWQHTIQVVRCISDDRQNLELLSSTDLMRQAVPSSRTIYQMARTIKLTEERFIKIVETIHTILLILNDDEDATSVKRTWLLNKLGESSRLITSIIDPTSSQDDKLHLAIKTLIIDGILGLRLRLLANTMTNNDEQLLDFNDFQQELDHYRSLNRLMKLPKQRIQLFESILRISSGLNPLSIQTLFEGALKQQTCQLQMKQHSPHLDVIAAILLFCHFLPSTVFHYRTLLHHAANIASTTRKNHDLHRLRQQCLTLIRQPYLTL